MSKQYSIFDECFIDSFAGGGGASTGIEMATGHPIDIAINHDESAIMMHRRNHPFTEHYREDIWQVDPKTAVRGRHVRLAWFSPDCKHFSRAKGAALVDKKIRGLAWVVLKWAAAVKPDVIMLENVPEFTTWGPVRNGKPVKKKAGKTYQRWLSQLEALGYKVETNKLCAADYGAPTIRTRFHLIARCDGKPIVWPKRTHAPRDHVDVERGKLEPWKSASEIIDFSLPCPSIFASKSEIKEQYGINAMRPLKENTLRRIARGLDKFVIKSAEPFIVQHKFDNSAQSVKNPLSTITAVGAHEVVNPIVTPYAICNNAGNAPHGMDEPVPTVTTGGRNILVAPTLIQYHTEQSDKEHRGQKLDEPIQTVDAANRYGLSSVFLSEYYGNACEGVDLREPAQTVTAKDRECLNAAWLTQYFSGEGHYHSTEEPLATITTMEREGVTLAHLAHFKGKDKGQSCHDPLMTVTARDGQFADVRTTIVKWDGQTDLGYWSEVRKMLNQYCGYNLADDEILLLNIRGIWYFISDIGLRMLTPRELYDAMGFPHDYIIDKDVNGRPITRADQVARCGNAVCPAVAEAIVRANLPEYCKIKIPDMAHLRNVMTS
jgi:DNA (cytosine-5)-methyltransferase 1